MSPICRCGYTGEGAHLCHRCADRPGDRCLRGGEHPYSLAGAQPKLAAVETWACEPCREAYRREGGTVLVVDALARDGSR